MTMPARSVSVRCLARNKFGLVIVAAAAQGSIGWTCALFVTLQVPNHRSCQASVWFSSHSIAHYLSFDTVLLRGKGESHRGSIVQFRIFTRACIGPSVQGDILQAKEGVIGAERMLAQST